jgi:uncharacterized membrane protein YccC
MKAWLQTHHGKLQFGLRMTVAALLSYALGEAIGLTQVYWAVLSSVIVIQGSVGGSVRAGLYRLVGTVGGAFWGAVVAGLMPHGNPAALALALLVAIAPLSIVTAFRIDYRVAPITAIIVLMGAALQQAAPFSAALERVFEITLGSAVAVAVALFLFPARAHALFALSAGEAVADMARIVSMLAEAHGQGVDREALLKTQLRCSAAIARAELRAGEAKIERANRLADGPDPEPLSRTLRRLRHDMAMLARALVAPFPEAMQSPFVNALTAVLHALAAWLSGMAGSLSSGKEAPSLHDMKAALEDLRSAIAQVSEKRFTSSTEKEDIRRVFVLLFIFDQVLQNQQDLSDLACELAEHEQKTAP